VPQILTVVETKPEGSLSGPAGPVFFNRLKSCK
jgi:hypothetical protein